MILIHKLLFWFKCGVIILLTLIIIRIVIKNILHHEENDVKSESILVQKIDSTCGSRLDSYEELKLNFDKLIADQDAYINKTTERDSLRLQLRLAFIALFVGLIIIFFSEKITLVMRLAIYATIWLFFLSFYLYDIKEAKNEETSKYRGVSTDKTINDLLCTSKSDLRFYEIKRSILDEYKPEHGVLVILKAALSPDLPQIAFYFTPLLVINLLFLILLIGENSNVAKNNIVRSSNRSFLRENPRYFRNRKRHNAK